MIAGSIEDHTEGDPAMEADEDELAGIKRRMEEIRNAAKVYDTKEKAVAGCIVTIAHGGTLQIEQGLVRPDDLAALHALRQPEAAANDTGEDEESASARSIHALVVGGKRGDNEADEEFE